MVEESTENNIWSKETENDRGKEKIPKQRAS